MFKKNIKKIETIIARLEAIKADEDAASKEPPKVVAVAAPAEGDDPNTKALADAIVALQGIVKT
jgi:hypothetical protein